MAQVDTEFLRNYGSQRVLDVQLGGKLEELTYHSLADAIAGAQRTFRSATVGIVSDRPGSFDLYQLTVPKLQDAADVVSPATPQSPLTSTTHDKLGFDQVTLAVRLLDKRLAGIVTDGKLVK